MTLFPGIRNNSSEMLLPSSCSNLLSEAVKMINSLLERKVQDIFDTFMSASTFELMESFVPKSLPMPGLVSLGDLAGTFGTLTPPNPCKFSMAILMKAGELQVSMVRRIVSSTIEPVFNTLPLPYKCWISSKDEVGYETWLLTNISKILYPLSRNGANRMKLLKARM